MKDQTMKLSQPFLDEMGFLPCGCRPGLNPEGVCYAPPAALGEGYYWYYEREGMFTIGVIDLRFREDLLLEYRQQPFLSLNYYDTVSAEELSPYKRIRANCIRGHVSEGELFRARYHKNVPMRGVDLMLMPGYYRGYLEQRYPGEFPAPQDAFRGVDGAADFPELVLLMRQLRAFQGRGVAAHLFYESKVSEALSLIIGRTRGCRGFVPGGAFSQQDLVNLDAVRCYLEDHFASDVRAGQLARIACMGETKLRYSFKKRYGCTITEYLQNKRVAHAEALLAATDFPIRQVAQAVGCRHAGRFAALFRQATGLLPEEYRRLMQNK